MELADEPGETRRATSRPRGAARVQRRAVAVQAGRPAAAGRATRATSSHDALGVVEVERPAAAGSTWRAPAYAGQEEGQAPPLGRRCRPPPRA